MSVALKKLDGVESVDVSLEHASADITLKPNNRIRLAQLREVIRKSGYPTRDAEISARGRIENRDGRSVFDAQNGEFLPLTSNPAAASATEVEIVGTSRITGKTDRLTITRITPSTGTGR